MTVRSTLAVMSAVIAAASSANADPPPPEREPSAADVANEPMPGSESGRTDPIDDGDSTAREVGRGLLFVPKVAADVALTPVRTGVWLFDRYQLDKWYYRIFFNDERTIGLYPTAAFESGFGVTGLTGGARFVDRDLFGEREHLAIQAAVGTAYYYRQLYSLNLRTGDRFGRHFALELDGGYEIRPRDPFYGIGNGDTAAPPTMPIDPRTDSTSVGTRYSQHRARIALTADARVVDGLHVRTSGALSDVTFGGGLDGFPTDMVYSRSGLVGWTGVEDAYGELELRYDSRRAAAQFEPSMFYAEGGLASAFAGRLHRLDQGADYWRYGLDLQKFLRIARGPRVLALRLHGEGVTGSRDEVPFVELPRLGGGSFLRGYDLDRFRDRVAAFGSAAYEWDLSSRFSANIFSDVGRVYSGLDALSVDHLRVGYGAGIVYTEGGAFVMEASLASSIDGGLFLNLAFNPVFDLDERVRRR